MRSTIPLGGWRLAVDLIATRAIRQARGRPASGCVCVWCRNWRCAHAEVMPPDIHQALRRIGIDPADPTDLYADELTTNEPRCRVTFHCVGTILSGPALWRHQEEIGRLRVYHPLEREKETIGLSVAYQKEVDARPSWAREAMTPLIQVDFRLAVPWSLSEKRPA
jgi:hypothetical protein